MGCSLESESYRVESNERALQGGWDLRDRPKMCEPKGRTLRIIQPIQLELYEREPKSFIRSVPGEVSSELVLGPLL